MHKHSNLYAFLIAMRPAYRYALTGALLSVLIITWFNSIYVPAHLQLKRMRKEIVDAQAQQRMMGGLQTEIDGLKKSIAALRTTEKSQSSSGNQGEIPFLVECANKAGITLSSCTIEGEKNKGWYTKRSIAVDAQGNWFKLVYFFEQLKDAPRAVQCRTARINRTKEQDYALHCTVDFYIT